MLDYTEYTCNNDSEPLDSIFISLLIINLIAHAILSSMLIRRSECSVIVLGPRLRFVLAVIGECQSRRPGYGQILYLYLYLYLS